MLDPQKVQHVERLLAGGEFSQRQIARLVGVGRATVAAIALREHRRFNDLDLQPVRCLGCGGLVFPPCRACALRAEVAVKNL